MSYKIKKYKEINPFSINAKTKPTFENEIAKWYLVCNDFDRFSGWRAINKETGMSDYVVLRNKDSAVMWTGLKLEDMAWQLTAFETATRGD
ncbi:MAG: hypothetical protein IIZ78_00700 [Clostridiales bacterium]|nr:hypothetical protein [Clostridiales bacterium]